ncbi:MAG: ABC transporter permease [Oscillospiraceae bacterium]|jgi:NitT/TauT family transport system permease protein|nr:ABC transporter permease [Oscillospiraceae bacterium]
MKNASKNSTGHFTAAWHFLTSLNKRLMGSYLIILFILLWQFAPSFGWTNPHYVPPFTTVLGDGAYIGISKILIHISISLKRVLVGFAVAMTAGLPLGFILGGGVPKVAETLRPLIAFLQQIPPYILYPVFMLIIGPGENGIHLVIFWSVFWPVLNTTIQGVGAMDAKLIRCARTMNAGVVTVFFKVVLPAVFPNLMRGVRSGLTMGFLMLIGAESMGADSGVGWMINNAQRMAWVPRVYLGALIVCSVGFLLNWWLGVIERTFVDWKPVAEEAVTLENKAVTREIGRGEK